jgi:hypothetical protein
MEPMEGFRYFLTFGQVAEVLARAEEAEPEEAAELGSASGTILA